MASRFRVHTPLFVDIRTQWSLADIAAAIRSHEEGDFFGSAQLADMLGRVGRVEGCLNTRVSALIAKGGATTFRIEPPEQHAKDAGVKALCGDMAGWWWSVNPDWVWRQIASDAIMMGLAFGTREWFAEGKRWFFRLRPWPLHYLRWDDSLQRYVVQTKDGQHVIEPGDPEWWVYEPYGPRSWMHGAVRALGDLGHRRETVLAHWAHYCRRHGTPLLAIEEPEDSDTEQADRFFEKMQRSIAGGTVRLPRKPHLTGTGSYGFDIKIVEPKTADGWKAFEAFLNWVATEIAIRIKGQNLTTEVKEGSYAAAQQHGGTDALLLASDAQTLGTFAHDNVSDLWCRYNIKGHTPDKTPWPVWDTKVPESPKAQGEAMQAVGKGFQEMAKAGVQLNRQHTVSGFGWVIDRIEEPPAPAPEPGQPGGEGEPGPDDEPQGDGGDEPEGKAPAKRDGAGARRAHAAGTTRGGTPIPEGAAEGQAVLDAHAPDVAAAAGGALAPDLADVTALVARETSRAGVLSAVTRAYADMNPEALAAALEQALIVAELLGRYSAVVDQTAALARDPN